jgi:predicted SprT family Zn-dependent metalloprotease
MSYTRFSKLVLVTPTVPRDYRTHSHKVLPKSVAKDLARKNSREESKTTTGTFRCPRCQKFYSMSYSRFGKIGSFGDETYYCLDCIEELGTKFQKL